MTQFPKQIVSTLILLVFTAKCFAQTSSDTLHPASDTLHQKVIAYAAEKFAIARPFNIEYSGILPYSYSPKVNHLSWPSGKFTQFSQLKISSNLNLIKQPKWIFGVTLLYENFSTGVDLAQPTIAGAMSANRNFQYLSGALNFTYFSKLFNKRVIYGASIIADGSEQHLERIKGLAYGSIVLKANDRTKMTAGIIVNIDPTSILPVLPSFTYEHKFHDGLSLDVLLPKYLYLRKFISKNDRISLGTEFDRPDFYLYKLNPNNLSQKYEYQQLDVNSGLTYEHLLGNYFVFKARTGLRYTPNGKLFDKNDYSSPLYQTSANSTFFFNVGLSFDPFIKKRKN
jgi:hypothetical protein